MKAKNLLVIVIAFAMMGLSAKGQLTFQKTYGGPLDDEANAIQQTADGGYIIAGFSTSYGVGGADAYLIRTDTTGTILWTKTYGGANEDKAFSVQQTSDGGFIIAGETGQQYYHDVYIIKTNAIGDTTWTKSYGMPGDDRGYSVKQTFDGGYIIGGAYGTGFFDHVYLIKTDPTGSVSWSKTFNGASNDVGYSVKQTADSGYVIVGSATSFGPGNGDVYLIRTNANGDSLWSRTYGGTTGREVGNSIQQTTDGGFIIVGQTLSFGSGAGDVYLLKTDANGLVLWSKAFGGTNPDVANSVQQTTDKGYIIAGSTQSFGAGNSDVYLIRTDSMGNVSWSKTFGGAKNDYGTSVQQTADGGFVICGTSNSFTVDSTFDVYLIKTDANGNTGCNHGNAATNQNSPNSLTVRPATSMTGGAGGSFVVQHPTMSSGGTATTLCTNLGVNEISVSNSILIYPNPFTTQATLTLQGSYHSPTLFIYNLMGQEVRSLPIGANNQLTIQRNNLPAGMYFYKVIEDNKEVLGVGKMVVE